MVTQLHVDTIDQAKQEILQGLGLNSPYNRAWWNEQLDKVFKPLNGKSYEEQMPVLASLHQGREEGKDLTATNFPVYSVAQAVLYRAHILGIGNPVDVAVLPKDKTETIRYVNDIAHEWSKKLDEAHGSAASADIKFTAAPVITFDKNTDSLRLAFDELTGQVKGGKPLFKTDGEFGKPAYAQSIWKIVDSHRKEFSGSNEDRAALYATLVAEADKQPQGSPAQLAYWGAMHVIKRACAIDHARDQKQGTQLPMLNAQTYKAAYDGWNQDIRHAYNNVHKTDISNRALSDAWNQIINTTILPDLTKNAEFTKGVDKIVEDYRAAFNGSAADYKRAVGELYTKWKNMPDDAAHTPLQYGVAMDVLMRGAEIYNARIDGKAEPKPFASTADYNAYSEANFVPYGKKQSEAPAAPAAATSSAPATAAAPKRVLVDGYKVQAGDNLTALALHSPLLAEVRAQLGEGASKNDAMLALSVLIAKANGIENVDRIHVGQVLKSPTADDIKIGVAALKAGVARDGLAYAEVKGHGADLIPQATPAAAAAVAASATIDTSPVELPSAVTAAAAKNADPLKAVQATLDSVTLPRVPDVKAAVSNADLPPY